MEKLDIEKFSNAVLEENKELRKRYAIHAIDSVFRNSIYGCGFDARYFYTGELVFKFVCNINEELNPIEGGVKIRRIKLGFNSYPELKRLLDKAYGYENYVFDQLIILNNEFYYAEGHGEVFKENEYLLNIDFKTERNEKSDRTGDA